MVASAAGVVAVAAAYSSEDIAVDDSPGVAIAAQADEDTHTAVLFARRTAAVGSYVEP